MQDALLIHYGEIGIKGKNRAVFERQLVANVKKAFGSLGNVKRGYGRIIAFGIDPPLAVRALKNVFGIAHYAFSKRVEAQLEIIEKTAVEILQGLEFDTFGVRVTRANKDFPLTSMEIGREVGAYILKKTEGKKVDLTYPNIWLYVDIVGSEAYLYTEKLPGLGGLPVGVSGRGLVMISGGIDSPVAAYFMMKRGMPCDFIHFHTYPCTEKESIDKVDTLVKILNKYQCKATLYLVPFGKLQKEIVRFTRPRYRVLLYRRFMVRIAQEIAKNNDIKALITGESLGQVASQTIENIRITGSISTLPILRPLIGMDKLEIVNKAKEIGTYETSILPHEDCCTRFVPKNPIIKGKLEDVEREEAKLNVSDLVSMVKKEVETVTPI